MTREELITEIKGYVKQNGNGEIQGDGLQNILVLMSNFFNSIEEFEEYKESISTSWAEFVQSNNNALENKANKQHTHNISDVVGLEELLTQVVQGLDDELKKTATKVELEAVKMELENTSKALESISQTGAKGEVKGDGVLTLPQNALSSVGSLKIGGLTALNLIINGEPSFKLTSSVAENKGIEVEEPNEVYYLRANVVNNPSNGINVRFQDTIRSSLPYELGYVSYIGVTTDSPIIKRIGFYSGREEPPVISGYICVNLTKSFGAGNEPTKEWCDEHFPNFFDGTKSVSAMKRVKSIGSNKVKEFKLTSSSYLFNKDGNIYQRMPSNQRRVADVIGEVKASYFSYIAQLGDNGARLLVNYKDGSKSNINKLPPADILGRVVIELDNTKYVDYISQTYGKSSDDWSFFDVNSLYIGSSFNYDEYEESNLFIKSTERLESLNHSKDIINESTLYKYVKDGELLTTPIISKLQVSGSIVNKPNGTIFVEDVANSIGLYDGGIEPIYNLPILKIDVISKIGDDGIAIELDATKATITNRVVRHPDLKDGDIVYIEYYHDLNPIYGDNTLTYYNSYKVKQNPADSKYYELSLDFNEQGEVILKKTEV